MPKVPRYSEFQSSSALASAIKRRNGSRGGRAEVLLRCELWRRGLRYRLHVVELPGKPDLVFRSSRVVVFVDGDFWHGRHWKARRARLTNGSNAGYWIPKIEANIARDRKTTRSLRELGWKVVRLWETDVISDVVSSVDIVLMALSGGKLPKPKPRHPD
jgi:DNA mismatch endonuclease (patch repair protein)